MKNIFLFIILSLFSTSCKAQSPIYDITDVQHRIQDVSGAYHKDMNNLLNPFEGTFIYTNGDTSFKIELQKKLMSSMNGYLYEDLIIGEYQYIDNGIEKVNTLPQLNINYPNQSNHSITGNLIITQGDVGCIDCLSGEKALSGGLVDSSTHSGARLFIRRITVNGQPAIKIFIGWRMRYKHTDAPALLPPSIPGGSYTLMKQL